MDNNLIPKYIKDRFDLVLSCGTVDREKDEMVIYVKFHTSVYRGSMPWSQWVNWYGWERDPQEMREDPTWKDLWIEMM